MFKNAIRIFVFCFFCCGVSPLFSQSGKVQIDTTEAERQFSNPSYWRLLLNQFETRSELELAGSQVEAINQQLEEIEKKLLVYREGIREYQKSDDFKEEEALKRVAEFQETLKESVDQIKEELLPHQLKRLRQIVVQYCATTPKVQEDLTRVFLLSKLVADLDFSAKQKKKIAEFYDKRDEQILEEYLKFEEKFREIDAESYKEILSVLTEEQKAEAEEQIGPPSYVFLKPDNAGGQLKQKRKK